MLQNQEVSAILDVPYQGLNDPTKEPYFSYNEIPGVGVLHVFAPEDVLKVHRDAELLSSKRWVSRAAVPWFMSRKMMGFLFNSPAAHHPGPRLDALLGAIDDVLAPAKLIPTSEINEAVERFFPTTNEPYNLADRAKDLTWWAIRRQIGALDFMPSPEEQQEFNGWMYTFNANRALKLFSHARELGKRCDAYIAERQREGLRNDPIDDWIRKERAGLLDPGDASLLMQVLLHAGTGTTEHVIGNTTASLLTELSKNELTDFIDRSGSDREMGHGLAEATRLRPAAPARPFGVHKVARIAGHLVFPGIHMINASMASVNRAPSVVGDEPEKFILGRPNRSISFGSHQPKDEEHGKSRRCPGETLSRRIATPAVRRAIQGRPEILAVESVPGAVVQIPQLILG